MGNSISNKTERFSNSFWAAIATMVVGVLFGLTIAHQRRDPTGLLHVAKNDLDLGVVWSTRKYGHSMLLQNRSTKPITVSDIRSSCNCTTIRPRQFTLDPGGSVSLLAEFDLMPRSARTVTVPTWPIEITCTAISDQRAIGQWNVSGTVRNLGTIEPVALIIREPVILGDTLAEWPITLHAVERITNICAQAEDGTVTAILRESNNTSATIVIKPNPALIPAKYRTSVDVSGEVAVGSRASLHVPIQFEVVRDIEAIPEIIAHGTVPVGSDIHESIVLRSRVGEDFQLNGINVDSTSLKVSQQVPARANRFIVQVLEHVAELGQQHRVIDFGIRSRGQEYTIQVRLTYIGIPAAEVRGSL